MIIKLYGDNAKAVEESQTFQVLRKYSIEGRDVAELVEVGGQY